MFLEERYEKIIDCIEKEGKVKVKDLSNKFKVTEECIRKDLRELENRGKLEKSLWWCNNPKRSYRS